MMKIKEGSIVRGKVTGIQPYGAFVRLGDEYRGLIHISEFSDCYVKDIRNFVNVGQYIDVKLLRFLGVEILKLDSDNRQAQLTLKGISNYSDSGRKSRMKASDFETSNGFAPLAQHLPIWIRDSLDKIARVSKED